MGTFLPIISVMMMFSAQLAECFGRKNRPMLKMNKKKVFYINIKLRVTNAKRFVPAAENLREKRSSNIKDIHIFQFDKGQKRHA